MKRAVIFLHGNKPTKSLVQKYVRPTDTIICADGGTLHAVAAGIQPNVYIGDLDSITKSLHKKLQKGNIEWHIFQKEKDETDSELALDYALKKGFKEILFFGVFGSRTDHLLANLTMFARAPKDVKIKIFAGKQELYFVHDYIRLTGNSGEYVSLIPLQNDVTGITTTGLKWQLSNGTLEFGKSRGTSNEFTQKTAEITIKSGSLLVIQTRTK